MKTPSATPQTAPQAKAAKPSLAEQIAASKAQGGKPPVAASSSGSKSKQSAAPEAPEEKTRAAEVRAALVKEWKELWQDRVSRIVLLGTAGTVALGIVGGAVLYSRKPVEPKKKTDPAALVEKESVKEEDPITPEERYAIHRSIIEGVPYVAPKPENAETEVPRETEKQRPVREKSQPAAEKPQPIAKPDDAEKLRAKRAEIATTGQLKVSTNPEDMKATMDALKEWSRQDAESARAKASKR
ncbi:MAG: hypothetical protein WA194_05500 [Patescibacteria group bacterium]